MMEEEALDLSDDCQNGDCNNQQWWIKYAGHCAVVHMFHGLMHMLMTSAIVCIHVVAFGDVATSE
jgi:hypothetical protein